MHPTDQSSHLLQLLFPTRPSTSCVCVSVVIVMGWGGGGLCEVSLGGGGVVLSVV